MIIDVASILYELDIDVTRESGDELWALCPGHLARTGRVDHNPSWSINQVTFAHHCLSCGYSGSLNSLYEDVRGEVPDDLEWELTKASVQNTLTREVAVEVPEGPPINEWQLHHFDDVPSRLLTRRHLTRDAIDDFEVRWDKARRMWVLPMRLPDGTLFGYQFRQKGTFLNHPAGINKSDTLFGISHQIDRSNTIAVVESPLDAVRLYGLGMPCVSSMGAYISPAQSTILCRHFSFIMSALDNDEAGVQGLERLQRLTHNRGVIVLPFDYRGLSGKDPGDEPDDNKLRSAWRRTLALGVTQ